MQTIELQLDERTLECARRIATSRPVAPWKNSSRRSAATWPELRQQGFLFGECLRLNPS
jgi:hypothetical protein